MIVKFGTRGKVLQVRDATPRTTIASVKSYILEQEGLPPYHQCIVYDDRAGAGARSLGDDETMAMLGVTAGVVTLNLMVQLRPPMTFIFERSLIPGPKASLVRCESPLKMQLRVTGRGSAWCDETPRYKAWDDDFWYLADKRACVDGLNAEALRGVVEDCCSMSGIQIRRMLVARVLWPVPDILRFDYQQLMGFLYAARHLAIFQHGSLGRKLRCSIIRDLVLDDDEIYVGIATNADGWQLMDSETLQCTMSPPGGNWLDGTSYQATVQLTPSTSRLHTYFSMAGQKVFEFTASNSVMSIDTTHEEYEYHDELTATIREDY